MVGGLEVVVVIRSNGVSSCLSDEEFAPRLWREGMYNWLFNQFKSIASTILTDRP